MMSSWLTSIRVSPLCARGWQQVIVTSGCEFVFFPKTRLIIVPNNSAGYRSISAAEGRFRQFTEGKACFCFLYIQGIFSTWFSAFTTTDILSRLRRTAVSHNISWWFSSLELIKTITVAICFHLAHSFWPGLKSAQCTTSQVPRPDLRYCLWNCAKLLAVEPMPIASISLWESTLWVTFWDDSSIW